MPSDVVELVFDEGACGTINGFMYIFNYPNLRSLTVKKSAFKNVNTLTISNNTQLERIVIEDGDSTGGAFQKVKMVIIQGEWLKGFCIDLPNLSSMAVGHYGFEETVSLTLKSRRSEE